MERDSDSDFPQIYEKHAAGVFLAAAGVLRDAALAEDVTQEVFLALWRGGGYDQSRGPLGTYLRIVARSRALDVWRRRRTSEQTMARLQERARSDPSAVEEPSRVVLHAADRELARRGVRSLPADQRQAIGLTYWAGLTMQQVADVQDVPLGTAKSRVRLALRKLALDPAAHMAAEPA
jgi:RNA polymerase sigma-70 factor (ECF subfamily)